MFILNNSNWLDYAIKNYDTELNLKCEVYDDIKLINGIKKHLLLYINGDSKQIRLIINNILILTNVFGVECAFNLLLFKLDEEFYSIIKTCFYYLRLIDIKLKKINLFIENKESILNQNIDKNTLYCLNNKL